MYCGLYIRYVVQGLEYRAVVSPFLAMPNQCAFHAQFILSLWFYKTASGLLSEKRQRVPLKFLSLTHHSPRLFLLWPSFTSTSRR